MTSRRMGQMGAVTLTMGSGKMGQMGAVTLTVGSGKIHTGVWWGNLKERNLLEDLGIDR
jgi:hypothetical protein